MSVIYNLLGASECVALPEISEGVALVSRSYLLVNICEEIRTDN